MNVFVNIFSVLGKNDYLKGQYTFFIVVMCKVIQNWKIKPQDHFVWGENITSSI